MINFHRVKTTNNDVDRFRITLEAYNISDEAIKDCIELPTERPFNDSCVTLGTKSMT